MLHSSIRQRLSVCLPNEFCDAIDNSGCNLRLLDFVRQDFISLILDRFVNRRRGLSGDIRVVPLVRTFIEAFPVALHKQIQRRLLQFDQTDNAPFGQIHESGFGSKGRGRKHALPGRDEPGCLACIQIKRNPLKTCSPFQTLLKETLKRVQPAGVGAVGGRGKNGSRF